MPPSERTASGEDLGAEFLTYLWHASEAGVEEVFDKKPVRLQVAGMLQLRSPDGTGTDVVVKGEQASASPEVFVALWRGALVVRARVQLDINGVVVAGTLKSPDLTLTGCKLPKADDKETGVVRERGEKEGGEAETDRAVVVDEARLLDRSATLDMAQDVVDQWFKKFLADRGTDKHVAWANALKKWVAEQIKALNPGKLPM